MTEQLVRERLRQLAERTPDKPDVDYDKIWTDGMRSRRRRVGALTAMAVVACVGVGAAATGHLLPCEVSGLCSDEAPFADSPQPPLTGRWVPVDVPSVDEPPRFDPEDHWIVFREDGLWRATDGCNALSGTYHQDRKTGAWESASDLVAGSGCAEGGDIPYALLLAMTHRLTFADDGSVTFTSSGGETILVLRRSERGRFVEN